MMIEVITLHVGEAAVILYTNVWQLWLRLL